MKTLNLSLLFSVNVTQFSCKSKGFPVTLTLIPGLQYSLRHMQQNWKMSHVSEQQY